MSALSSQCLIQNTTVEFYSAHGKEAMVEDRGIVHLNETITSANDDRIEAGPALSDAAFLSSGGNHYAPGTHWPHRSRRGSMI